MHRLVLATAVALSLTACSGSSDEATPQATGTPCPTPGAGASTALPADVPPIDGTAYEYSAQGKTLVWFFAVDGSGADLPSLRDAYDTKLTGKGYKILDTDQEAGSEAEASFTGPHNGTTNFRPLCAGKVVLRLKLTE